MQQTERKPLSNIGQVVATPGALAALEKSGQSPMDFLTRHVTGDWGELWKTNSVWRKASAFSAATKRRRPTLEEHTQLYCSLKSTESRRRKEDQRI